MWYLEVVIIVFPAYSADAGLRVRFWPGKGRHLVLVFLIFRREKIKILIRMGISCNREEEGGRERTVVSEVGGIKIPDESRVGKVLLLFYLKISKISVDLWEIEVTG